MSRSFLVAIAVVAACGLRPCAWSADQPAAPAAAANAQPAEDFNRQGLVLWLDASHLDSVAHDADGRVQRWADRTGARTAVRGGEAGPRLVEHAMHDLPVLRFDGKEHLEVPAIRDALGEVSVFIVAQRLPEQAAGGGDWQRWISSDGGGGNDDRDPGFALHDGERSPALAPSVLEMRAGGAKIGALSIGSNAHAGGNHLRADIAEILVFDRGFISEGQLRAVRDYLTAKWGATCNADKEGWTRSGPLTDPPARRTDAFPLSDQGNAGGWVRFEPMCDEFDGDALDAVKWWDHNPAWKGRPPAPFLAKNVRVTGGELLLTMSPEPGTMSAERFGGVSSAAVQSRNRIKYGYFETRAKPMRSHGSSGFWLYYHDGTEHTEIDIFEIGAGAPRFERFYHMNLHVFHSPARAKEWGIGDIWKSPTDLADDYHVYGLDWNEKTIEYFIDGVSVRRVDNSDWHQALTLNIDSETMPGWFGLPDAKELPSTYRVDYVRVWRKQAMEAPLPGFTDGR